jgi:threonine dehydrogenase-like Zn-dependent dehydrogenase
MPRFKNRSWLPSLLATSCLLFACHSVPQATPVAVEVRSITPPNLDAPHLGERILCYRPMRHGSPNMSVQQLGGQTIAHDYGHGGSGWTLAPGSAKHVIDLAERAPERAGRPRSEPVVVVGGGVIGLFTAYELVQRGYTDVTVVADRFDGLTSHNAGGLLAPVSMNNDPAMQAVIDRIGVDAYRFYAAVARGEHPEFRGGAVIIPAYFERRDDSGLEPYVGVVMKPAKDVVLDFGNGTRRNMVAYDDGIFIDTAVMMKGLRDWLGSRVRFEQRKVERFSELKASLVFDCAGLGSGALNGDAKMVSVQGHLIMLKDQRPQDLQHMILVYFDEGRTEVGQKVKRSFYIFPKHLPGTGPDDVGVVGGTFVEGATGDTPNRKEFDLMLEGAKRFYGM